MIQIRAPVLLLVAGGYSFLAAQSSPASSILQVDYHALVSRADIRLDQPVPRKESGLPLGNGRTGSLVWTTPGAMHLQVNRVDVYANNKDTNSFPQRDSDYGFGVGFVDIGFGDSGPDVFPARTLQHLAVYDALLGLEGAGVKVRGLAWTTKDVVAFEIEDSREHPLPIGAVLRMLRPPQVRTRSHLAVSQLETRDGRIVLTQKFSEDAYHCASALALAIVGRDSQARITNDQELKLTAMPGQGKFTILMASAASFDPNEDIASAALSQLDAAAAKGFPSMLEENRTWWHDFWSKAFIHLHSADGNAGYVEQNYTYFLYVMGSSSRGKFPPRFGGMLWNTGGDYRRWGVQHWWHNTSCYYRALPATNRLELMDPMFDMYSAMADSCANAARELWGSQGLWIPETVWFDGVQDLPDEIASEMRDLYLLRKPWELRSRQFDEFASRKHPHSSLWNWKAAGRWDHGEWIYSSKYNSPYGEVVHIFSTTAKIAYQFWLRYEYTLDEAWLRDRAYPIIKGAAEFYRNFPNVRKGPDGSYHIHNVNDHEPIKAAQDTLEELTAMHGILPVAIRASEILGVDDDLRPRWREFLDNLTTLPTNDDPTSLSPRLPGEPRMWASGRMPFLAGNSKQKSDHLILPLVYYDLLTLENPDSSFRSVAEATFDALFPGGINSQTPVSVLHRSAIAAAMLGRAEATQYMVPNQMRVLRPEGDFVEYQKTRVGVMPNRMTLREGEQSIGVQRLGRAGEALQLALLQSLPPGPGQEPVIRVFPAWPKAWDAEYTLLARRGFLVTSSMRKGKIEFVELSSQRGAACRIRNPWPDSPVSLYRNGARSEELKGELLEFPTRQGEAIVLVPRGVSLEKLRRRVLASSTPSL